MEYSMLKTFGMKYRTSVTELKKKYKKNGRFGVDYEKKQEQSVVTSITMVSDRIKSLLQNLLIYYHSTRIDMPICPAY